MASKKGIIGILTGGGDVPGLNPAIRGVTLRALHEGYEVIGIPAPRRLGRVGGDGARQGLRQLRQFFAFDGRDRGPRGTDRRNVPAFLANESGTSEQILPCRRT